MSDTSINCYKLQRVLDNKKYEGFAFEDNASIRTGEADCSTDDFSPRNIASVGRNWSMGPLMPIWKPRRVVGNVKPQHDFPCIKLMIPAFSIKAVQALEPRLSQNGELLRLDSDVGEYYAYNTLTVLDALDIEKSVIQWLDKRKKVTALKINKYAFKKDVLEGAFIFRIVESPIQIYVTNKFMDIVTEAGLDGFDCPLLWSSPPAS
jgi:hypothetical protein